MQPLCIGTYTRREPHVNGTADGMILAQFDAATGLIAINTTVDGLVNPSFVATAPNGRFLYVLSEATGHISAFALDAAALSVTPLNRQPSGGAGPAHLSVHPSGRYVLVAHYGSGSVAVLPVQPDGRLGTTTDVVQWHGRGPNQSRQEAPHAHMIRTGPDGRVYAVDLGTDRLMVYTLEEATGQLRPAAQPWLALAPGSGPRHLAFHPHGRVAYVVNELNSSVTVVTLAEDGTLHVEQTVAMLPPDFTGDNLAAAIHVAPSGRFVYASNRGHDSIAIFAAEQDGRVLLPVGHCPTQGHAPRDFAITPDGRFLLAANQDSNQIATFAVDARSGELTFTGAVTAVATPVCLTWV